MAPSSGHDGTHVPHPTHMSARTAALGAPPATSGPVATRACTISNADCGTPHEGQNVLPTTIFDPHRGHGTTGRATGALGRAGAAPPRR